MMSFFESAPSSAACKVKICGLTSAADARRCGELGADALGFNFWLGSPRAVHPAEAAIWLRELPPQPLRVGIFVNASPEEILALLRSGCVDAAQLHGSESAEDCKRVLDAGFSVIKAMGLREQYLPGELEPFLKGSASAILLDTSAPGVHGGTGKTVDWSLAANIVAAAAPIPVLLAGGLNPGNVFQAISTVRPHGVDVASGVETAPGCKDWAAVREFIVRAHSALPSAGTLSN